MTDRTKKWIRRGLTWVLAIAALTFVIRMVPFRDRCNAAGECEAGLFTTLGQASPAALVGLFAAYMVGTVAWAARWRALLGIAGIHVPLFRVWRVTLEAQAGGILLPGGVAGDALRFAYVRQVAPEADLGKIAASILADRVVGLVTLCGLAALSGVAFGVEGLGKALPVLAAIPAGAVGAWFVLRARAVRDLEIFRAGLLGRLARPVLEYANAENGPSALMRGFVLSVGVSAIQLLVVRGFVGALHAQPTREAWVFVGTTLAMMVAAIPAVPGAWGTADAAYVLFFGKAGIAPSVAAAACLLYRIYWYASGLLGAGLALTRRDAVASAPAPGAERPTVQR